MDLYDAMSTLRAVRRLRPDPIPEAVLHARADRGHLGADRRQPSAVADRRGEGRKEKAGARGLCTAPIGRPTSSTIENTWSRCHLEERATSVTRDRRRYLPRNSHARSPGHCGVLLQPGHDDDHR